MVQDMHQAGNVKPVVVGLLGAAGLLFVYFAVLGAAESPDYAFDQFTNMWLWILLLSAGFGMQLGLHVHIKAALRRRRAGAAAGVAASGGVSTVAMVACCVHHVTDVLPFFGLSAAAVFLVDYQDAFIALGVFSNLIGVTMMLRVIQKHGLSPKAGLFRPLFLLDMKTVLRTVVVTSVVAVAATFLFSGLVAASQIGISGLAAQENNEKRVSVEVEPLDSNPGEPVKFSVSLNTHSGSLDFDMAKIAVLRDDGGRAFQPLEWVGSPPGGHHRSGTLVFPALGQATKSITLTLKGINGVPERTFAWALR